MKCVKQTTHCNRPNSNTAYTAGVSHLSLLIVTEFVLQRKETQLKEINEASSLSGQ